jgi:threonine dehydrogenase-like Zn-dependent dehydrogenase
MKAVVYHGKEDMRVDDVDDPTLQQRRALFLTDILPTGYMGAEFAAIEPGDVVVVYGCGPVGVFAQRSAALFGPAAIVAVDQKWC